MAGGIGGLPSSGPWGRPSAAPASQGGIAVSGIARSRRMRPPGARAEPSARCRSPSDRASDSPCAGSGGLTAAELIGLAVGLRHARAIGAWISPPTRWPGTTA